MPILEELYDGNMRPGERNESADAADRLIAVLSDEQKKLFEEFMDVQREVSVLTDAETFILGFRLGAKIMMDILLDGEMKEL